MIEEPEFEIYLYVEKKKFIIFLFDTKKLVNLYKNDLILNDYTEINFKELTKFLDENIFKIEKLLGKFIKDIFLIIKDDLELETNISIKKKNINNTTNKKNLTQALVESRDIFQENNQNQEIIHMLIDNYVFNGKKQKDFIENLDSEFLCLDIKFITLSDEFTSQFDKILEKYQIKVKHLMSGKYLKNFMKENNVEMSLIAHEITKGLNPNEIKIIPKIQINGGFFERFFQLFS
ncbi:MAG: hypothetical protein CNC05_03195 [Pelagibacterales bacterium MED-G42]|nr:MAG: hypothetical protein CNC05_03195 [Pelagibacterales bacterium MED-G42]